MREQRTTQAYRTLYPPYPHDAEDVIIPETAPIILPLEAIKPVHRILPNGTAFDRDRLVRILVGFKSDQALPPVLTLKALSDSYRFHLCNGLHRFLASVAAGFTHIPAVITPPIEW